jgi:hypothetical protein
MEVLASNLAWTEGDTQRLRTSTTVTVGPNVSKLLQHRDGARTSIGSIATQMEALPAIQPVQLDEQGKKTPLTQPRKLGKGKGRDARMTYKIGDAVLVHGLEKRSEIVHNGERAVVTAGPDGNGRYAVSTQSGKWMKLQTTHLEAQSVTKPRLERSQLPTWWKPEFERQGGDTPSKFAHLTALLHPDGRFVDPLRTLRSVFTLVLALAFRPHHRRDRLLVMAQLRAAGLRQGIERVRAAASEGKLGGKCPNAAAAAAWKEQKEEEKGEEKEGGVFYPEVGDAEDKDKEDDKDVEDYHLAQLLKLLDLYESYEAGELALDDEQYGVEQEKYHAEKEIPRLHRLCYPLAHSSQHQFLQLFHFLAGRMESAALEHKAPEASVESDDRAVLPIGEVINDFMIYSGNHVSAPPAPAQGAIEAAPAPAAAATIADTKTAVVPEEKAGEVKPVASVAAEAPADAAKGVEAAKPDEATNTATKPANEGKVLLKDIEEFKPYFKMLKMRLPKGAVVQKMLSDGKDPSILDLDPEKPLPASTGSKGAADKGAAKTEEPKEKDLLAPSRKMRAFFWDAIPKELMEKTWWHKRDELLKEGGGASEEGGAEEVEEEEEPEEEEKVAKGGGAEAVASALANNVLKKKKQMEKAKFKAEQRARKEEQENMKLSGALRNLLLHDDELRRNLEELFSAQSKKEAKAVTKKEGAADASKGRDDDDDDDDDELDDTQDYEVAKKAAMEKRRRTKLKKAKEMQQKAKLQAIEGKRAQNMLITLKKLKLSAEEVLVAVLELDVKTLPPAKLELVKLCLPSEEERTELNTLVEARKEALQVPDGLLGSMVLSKSGKGGFLKGGKAEGKANIPKKKKNRGMLHRAASSKGLKPTSSTQNLANVPEKMSLLHPSEDFLVKLFLVPRPVEKLEVFEMRTSFEPDMRTLKNDLETIRMACAEVSTSVKLQELLQLVLEIGNFLNHGTRRAGTHGVRVGTLQKLGQMKSNQPAQARTLLHFIVRFAREHGKTELLSLVQDLPQCKKAGGLSISQLGADIRNLSSQLGQVEEELGASEREQKQRVLQQRQQDMQDNNGGSQKWDATRKPSRSRTGSGAQDMGLTPKASKARGLFSRLRKGSGAVREAQMQAGVAIDVAADMAWEAATAAATAATSAELAGKQWGAIVKYDATVRPFYDEWHQSLDKVKQVQYVYYSIHEYSTTVPLIQYH